MAANRFVRERGGEVYVWLDDVGPFATYKASLTRPRDEVVFGEFDAGGFSLFLDDRIERPDAVEVYVRRWPRRRVHVRGVRSYETGTGGGGGANGGGDDRVWDTGGGDGGGGGNGGGGDGG